MKKVYRLTSVILLVALLSIFMCVPALAEDLEGSADIYYLVKTNTFPDGNSKSSSLAYPLSSSAVELSSLGGNGEYAQWSIPYLNVPLTDVAETVIVSFSYALGVACSTKVDASSAGWSYSFPITSSPSATIEYTNHFGNQGFGNVDEIYTFSFAGGTFGSWGNEYWRSDGLSTVASFYGDELHPISNLKIIWPEQYYTYITKTNSNRRVYNLLYVTSFRVISSGAPSADLAELQGIASQIAQSNEILSAMYGDILAVCNAIYERNGSILEAQQLTNAYFEAIIPVLNSISSTTSTIYSLLSRQFDLLISTIQSESDDIQSTIDNAVERLIAYFDNVFSSSVNPALPGQSDNIVGQGDILDKADNDYQSSATDRFEAISADFTGFDGSVLSGVALGSTLFQRLWNVLGDYVIVYTFPLTLSICLVVVGRVSRQASRSRGGGSKKKEDSGGDTT